MGTIESRFCDAACAEVTPVAGGYAAVARNRRGSHDRPCLAAPLFMLLLMYGIGAIIGPFLASGLMTLGGSGYLFFFTGVVHLLLAVYVITRRFIRPQPARAEHRPFSEALASTQTKSQILEDELERAER